VPGSPPSRPASISLLLGHRSRSPAGSPVYGELGKLTHAFPPAFTSPSSPAAPSHSPFPGGADRLGVLHAFCVGLFAADAILLARSSGFFSKGNLLPGADHRRPALTRRFFACTAFHLPCSPSSTHANPPGRELRGHPPFSLCLRAPPHIRLLHLLILVRLASVSFSFVPFL